MSTVLKSYEERVDSLVKLGHRLTDSTDEVLSEIISKAKLENAWFTQHSVELALEGVVSSYLNEALLRDWAKSYESVNTDVKNVGLILAGNIPLVGFHDLMCVYLAGHRALVKYSSKDKVLITYILGLLSEFDDSVVDRIVFIDRLKDYDAVIATGSNTSSKYFEEYFGHVPHIIRKNRNGIAVIHGDETKEDIVKLGEDIFTYFGLGCRNVSKLYVPEGYKFDFLLSTLHDHYKEIVYHHKYMNNFEFNHALFMLNKENFLMSGELLVKEATEIASRIASVNYEHYPDILWLESNIEEHIEEIQCVVSKHPVGDVDFFHLGQAQRPSLSDYADGVDTMKFLQEV